MSRNPVQNVPADSFSTCRMNDNPIVFIMLCRSSEKNWQNQKLNLGKNYAVIRQKVIPVRKDKVLCWFESFVEGRCKKLIVQEIPIPANFFSDKGARFLSWECLVF